MTSYNVLPLRLECFISHNVSKFIHVVVSIILSPILWLNNIPFYVYTTFHPFMRWWTFRLFYCLAIINNAAMRTCIHILCTHMFFSWVYTYAWKLLDHVTLYLFEKLMNCFLKELYHFILQPTICACSSFSTSLSILVLSVFLKLAVLHGYEMVSHCGFDLPFPNA